MSPVPMFIDKELDAIEKEWIQEPPDLGYFDRDDDEAWEQLITYYAFKIPQRYLATVYHAPVVIEVYYTGLQLVDLHKKFVTRTSADMKQGKKKTRTQRKAGLKIADDVRCLDVLWDRFNRAMCDKVPVEGKVLMTWDQVVKAQGETSVRVAGYFEHTQSKYVVE